MLAASLYTFSLATSKRVKTGKMVIATGNQSSTLFVCMSLFLSSSSPPLLPFSSPPPLLFSDLIEQIL